MYPLPTLAFPKLFRIRRLRGELIITAPHLCEAILNRPDPRTPFTEVCQQPLPEHTVFRERTYSAEWLPYKPSIRFPFEKPMLAFCMGAAILPALA